MPAIRSGESHLASPTPKGSPESGPQDESGGLRLSLKDSDIGTDERSRRVGFREKRVCFLIGFGGGNTPLQRYFW